MSSIGSQDPVQLNVFQRDLVPASDLQAKALKLNRVSEETRTKLLVDKLAIEQVEETTEYGEKADQEKCVQLDEQATKSDGHLCEGQFKETILDSTKDFTQGKDLDKELLDGYMGETAEGYSGGYENNSYLVPNSEYYYSQESAENTDNFVLDEVPRQLSSSKLDLLEESELVIETETDFTDSIKDKILKRKESLKKNLTEGKDNIKGKVLKRKESFKQNLEGKKESLKQNRESLKHNFTEGKEDIMRQLSLLVNKVEAGVNKSVRKVASHIPNVTSPEDEKPLPDGTIEVSAHSFYLISHMIFIRVIDSFIAVHVNVFSVYVNTRPLLCGDLILLADQLISNLLTQIHEIGKLKFKKKFNVEEFTNKL